MMKRMLCLLLAVFLCVSLSSCLGADAEIYGRREVLEYVDGICKEPYDEISRELIEETPDNMEYHFRTRDRGLEFKANSYLSPIWIDATKTSFYTREISCNYVSVVHDLYTDEVEEILSTHDAYQDSYGWMELLSFSDLDSVVDVLLQADAVYSRELAYNEPEFLSEYPVARVHVVWYPSREDADAHDNWTNLTDVMLTGQNSREELYNSLANQYAQLCMDGKIENRGDVPQQYLQDKHVSRLDTIELDGQEMLYDSEDNPYSQYGLTTDAYPYAWYSDEQQSYMLVMDIGFISDSSSFPLINREYVRALGGSYTAEPAEDVYRSEWTIGDTTWQMRAVYDKDIQDLRITRNGETIAIPYVTYEEDRNVNSTFCVGVKAEDFCKLFDLRYTVDESVGKISFFSK